MRMIEIEIIGKGKALAKLDERNPKIREAFFQALPIEGITNLWGEEVYFDVPLQMENENPSPSTVAGDICYWSPGPAFCIFFGPTPASVGAEPRAASPCVPLGRIKGDATLFRNFGSSLKNATLTAGNQD